MNIDGSVIEGHYIYLRDCCEAKKLVAFTKQKLHFMRCSISRVVVVF